jgi:hypothetical protein
LILAATIRDGFGQETGARFARVSRWGWLALARPCPSISGWQVIAI